LSQQQPPERDSSYYKTLMAGMKKEYETELEKVKQHMKREKNRYGNIYWKYLSLGMVIATQSSENT